MDIQDGKRLKNSDIISNLPENITEEILSRLPIRDSVRTSVLSRSWRYKWTTRPHLFFNLEIGSDIVSEDCQGKFIYRMLNQHNGPISKFGLIVSGMTSMRSYPDIDQWILFSSRKSVREFTLSFCEGNSSYKIHSSLFSCANLTELTLRFCSIPSPPPTFKGFNHLTYLELHGVSVRNDEGLWNLIAKCHNLITLSMIHVYGLDGLDIDYAPKLETLTFLGSPSYISLNNTPHLVDARIEFTKLPDMNENTSLFNNLNFLSNLKTFGTGFYFLKILTQDHVRKLLPSTFKNLCSVSFHWRIFEDIDILFLVLGLITSSPNLTELFVKASRIVNPDEILKLKAATEYLEMESRSISCFTKLRCVEVENIACVGPMMELIKLILVKSPSLEQLKITYNEKIPDYINRESQALKELIQFPRASKIAEIIY